MQIKPGSTGENGEGNKLAHSRIHSDVEGGAAEQGGPQAPSAKDARARRGTDRIMSRTISFVVVLCSLAATALFGLAGLGVSHQPLASNPGLIKGAVLLRKYLSIHPHGAYTAASSEPTLLFSGNSTVIQPPPNTGAGLLRQSDCSITENYVGPMMGGLLNGMVSVSTVPNYQNFLHTTAGLTTTAGTWPNGCKDQELGIASRYGASLGLTRDGSSLIGAYIDFNNDLYAGSANLGTGVYSANELVTGNANTMVAADLDGDGYPDLLVQAAYSNSQITPITVYHNNGDGTFTAGVTVLSGVSVFGFTADDVNGDGKVDLVVATASNQLLVLPGNGHGTFGSTINSSLPSSGAYLATGDFNGDGNKDVVVGDAIMLGDGTGSFTAAPSSITTTSIGAPVVGDWNKDGKEDLAFMSSGIAGGMVSIYLGNGDGTFTAGSTYAAIGNAYYLGASDLDGDGNLDIFVGQANGGYFGRDWNVSEFQALMGRGDGSFSGAQAYPNGGYDGPASAPDAFTAADFHGKGYKDVLMLTNTGLELLTNNGKVAFTPSSPVSGTVPVEVAAADINGDGNSDAIFAESNSGSYDIAVALGNGDGTFQAETTTAVPALPERLVVGDFNGDGKPDVVTASGVSVYLLLNLGNGTLGPPALISTEANPVTGAVTASLRNNGKLDLVLTEATLFNATTAGAVGVLLGNGDGTFQPEADTTLNLLPLTVAVGDMNNDGIPDLVVASGDQAEVDTSLYVLPGKGDGTFGAATVTPLTYTYVTSLAVADFNGDGNADVLIATCCGSTYTSIALGNGSGSFSGISNLQVGASATSGTAVDLNGDGKPDILLNSNSVSSDLVVMLNQYGSAATTPVTTTTTLTSSATSVAPGGSVTLTATVTPVSGSGVPTGNATFYDGTTSLGTGTLAAGVTTFSTSSLSTGSHAITASYSGDSSNAASTSAVVTVTVVVPALTATTTELKSSAATVSAGASVTFTATTTASSGTPTGTVTFLDGTTALGTGDLNGSGIATYSTSELSAGSHSITASYAGDSAYAASTSSALTETVTAVAASYTLGISPSSLTIGQTASGTSTVTITPAGGFNQQITFSCSGLPSNATCNFSPSTVTPSGTAAATTTMTIATGVSNIATIRKFFPWSDGGIGSKVALGVLLLPWTMMMRRRRPLGKGTYPLLSLFIISGSLIFLSGCGGSGSRHSTPVGASTVTVTATSGAITQTAVVQLTVN
jgi:Bacterial Ig-like domain (group 3)/FG-GAP-like repeat